MVFVILDSASVLAAALELWCRGNEDREASGRMALPHPQVPEY
jgi:hypothetical protein